MAQVRLNSALRSGGCEPAPSMHSSSLSAPRGEVGGSGLQGLPSTEQKSLHGPHVCASPGALLSCTTQPQLCRWLGSVHRPGVAQVLDRAEQLADTGVGGLLLLEGDCGTGKTRLLQEVRCSPLRGLRRQAGGDGALTVYASGGDGVRRGRVCPPPPPATHSPHPPRSLLARQSAAACAG